MDFLVSALYSADENNKGALYGALVTHYNQHDICARPTVRYLDAEELRNTDIVEPIGFTFTNEGALVSDTECRKVVNSAMLTAIKQEVASTQTKHVGLLDVLLCGLKNNWGILVNLQDLEDNESETPIVLSINSLKVSDSSFNVYAPYRNKDGKYRTFSLVDITKNEATPFPLCIAKSTVPALPDTFSTCLAPISAPSSIHDDLFWVSAPLLPAYTFMGEAFVSFLAYNVAYYRIGLKVIREILGETKYAYQKEDKAYVRKAPKGNVSIVSSLKENKLDYVTALFGTPEELAKYLKQSEEAQVTFSWISLIHSEAHKLEKEGCSGDTVYTACVELLPFCRQQLLRVGLELLAQRFYVYSVGHVRDMLPLVLHGGGARGKAIKTVSR